MSCGAPSDRRPQPLVDLEQDLPTTVQDVAALRRLRRESRTLDPEQFLRLTTAGGHATAAELRRRRLFRGEPFEL